MIRNDEYPWNLPNVSIAGNGSWMDAVDETFRGEQNND